MLLALVLASAFATTAGSVGEVPQIAWQPDLEQAIALAKEEGRPLLLAFNMDGESASERIVREQYRDLKFVESANRCVAVIGSVFRHNPRDYDDRGRRIKCPRLGSITCGEHIALEPKLYEMLGGERISPRHAFIDTAGNRIFDKSLLFDLRELEADLHAAVATAPSPRTASVAFSTFDTWAKLFFDTLRKETPNRKAMLDGIAVNAHKLGVAKRAGVIARSALLDCSKVPTGIVQPAPDGLLETIARVDGDDEMSRFLLLARRVFNEAGAREALAIAYPKETCDAIERVIASYGTVDLGVILAFARAYRMEGKVDPKSSPPRGSVESLEKRIALAVESLDARPDDPAAMLELGRASLECARAKIDANEEGIELHLGDADQYLRRAKEKLTTDLTIDLDLAKIAYLKGDFEKEEQIALEVGSKLPKIPDPHHSDRATMEAALRTPAERQDSLRWIGDAAARLVNVRFGKDPAAQVEGIIRGSTALLLAAASPHADPVDWQTAVSFFDVLGMRSSALLIAEEGIQRFPQASEIRAAARTIAWKVGRPELGVEFSQRELSRRPDLAESSWYLGVDQVQLAEWRRRMELPDEAVTEYQRAISAFERCAALRLDYAGSARHQVAQAYQGIGFAHLLAQRQIEAAEQLVAINTQDPTIVSLRDGLDRETVDLIDNALEYRIGRPSPVDAVQLLERVYAARPGVSFFGRAFADAMLREALRADGRQDVAEGDRCLAAAIRCAELGFAADGADEEAIVTLAQCVTVHAERLLERGDDGRAREHLAIAAPLLRLDPPSATADRSALQKLAAQLREQLGEARPRFRPGR